MLRLLFGSRRVKLLFFIIVSFAPLSSKASELASVCGQIKEKCQSLLCESNPVAKAKLTAKFTPRGGISSIIKVDYQAES